MTNAAIAQESLPPVQYLIMETLAARHRLGEPYWTFPLRLRAALDALRDKGLIWTRSAPTPDLQAYLTDAGRACCLSGTYATPDTRERRDYDDLLGSIWLYIKWHYVTRQFTTAQKELFADAVDRSSERLNAGDPDLGVSPAERWWRPDYQPENVAEACDEPVWDGPYRMACSYTIVNGRCIRHGADGAKRPSGRRSEHETGLRPPGVPGAGSE